MHSTEFPLEMRVMDVMTWLEHHAPGDDWGIPEGMSREDEIQGMQTFFMGMPAQWMDMGLSLQTADEVVLCCLHLSAVASNIFHGDLMPASDDERDRWESALGALARLDHGGKHMETYPQVVMSLMHHAQTDGHDPLALLIALRRLWGTIYKVAAQKRLGEPVSEV